MGNTYEISDSDSGEREDEERQIAEAIRLSLLESPRSAAQEESSSSGGPQRGSKKRKMDVIEIVSDDEGDDGILDGINATRKAPKASNNSSVRTRAAGILGVTGPAIVSKPADGLLRTIGNRAQIERERLARLAELKRSPPDFGLLSDGAAPKSPKPVGAGPSRFSDGGFTLGGASAFEPSRFSTDDRRQIHTHGGRRLGDGGDSSDTTSKLLQYPNGVVKKTWADGYPKTDAEITFEEVLQKESLCVAVLSAFQWDIDWVLKKLPLKTIQKLVMVMHAKEEQDRNYKAQELSGLPRTTLVLPPMQGQVSCMHSKLMLLFHMSGNQRWLRIAVPSANLTDYDWGELGGVMENTVFIIDLPRLPEPNHNQTLFAKELHHFCTAKGMPEDVLNGLYHHDFSKTKDMAFVHSIGGSNVGKDWRRTGYSGLGTAVKALGLSSGPGLEFDFVTSSLGAANMSFISNMYRAALGDNGLKELQRCLSTKGAKKKSVLVVDDEITDDDSGTEFDDETNQERIMNHVRIYFPSYETVRLSKKGFSSGGTICFNSSWWDSPNFPRSVMRDCVSIRDGLLMHNKMLFARPSRQLQASAGKVDAWAYVGSANLSESAW
ncbi:tyrosyl-DNA phosphodiesterase-domain-containing protein [Tuber borchii]|uniref:Tyrosyl-DNA phosphodiesterase-domain-containing protein n=1 Tax=Tuber borchii TaxID=42251 RepID=A0A2T6ZDV7_TUBBO|nr:tyrosyl-DNA phosphodiesterase-domain-containing protein [Tuber borchii]